MPRRPRITPALRERITDLDGARCGYCRRPLLVGIPMVVEHILPLAAGGSSTVENICLTL